MIKRVEKSQIRVANPSRLIYIASMNLTLSRNLTSLPMTIKPLNSRGRSIAKNSTVSMQAQRKLFNTWNEGQPVTLERIQDYFDCMKKAGYRVSSRKQAKTAIKGGILSAFPQIAKDRDLYLKLDSIFQKIATGKTQHKTTSEAFIKRDKIAEALDLTPDNVRLIARFVYATGCRISEALTIRVKNCKVSGQAVRVKIEGKGSKERELPPVPVSMFQEIKAAMRSAEYLFQNHNPRSKTGLFSREYIWQELTKAGRKAGFYFRPHFLRHSFASALLENGTPLPVVSDLLGHSDVTTTSRFYSHVTLNEKDLEAVRI